MSDTYDPAYDALYRLQAEVLNEIGAAVGDPVAETDAAMADPWRTLWLAYCEKKEEIERLGDEVERLRVAAGILQKLVDSDEIDWNACGWIEYTADELAYLRALTEEQP